MPILMLHFSVKIIMCMSLYLWKELSCSRRPCKISAGLICFVYNHSHLLFLTQSLTLISTLLDVSRNMFNSEWSYWVILGTLGFPLVALLSKIVALLSKMVEMWFWFFVALWSFQFHCSMPFFLFWSVFMIYYEFESVTMNL